MFVIGNLIGMTSSILDFVLQLAMLVLIVNAVLSWFRPAHQPWMDVLDRISDVLCAPVRKLFPTVAGGIDFAPFIVMLVLQFLGRQFLVPTLQDLALRLR